MLESFRNVYGYEAEAQRRGLVPETRLRFHQEHSQPVMDALHTWFLAQFAEKKVVSFRPLTGQSGPHQNRERSD